MFLVLSIFGKNQIRILDDYEFLRKNIIKVIYSDVKGTSGDLLEVLIFGR
jgi:hypothetical protein